MSNDIVKILYDLIEGGATEKDWQIANEMKKQIEETTRKRKQLSKEAHDREQLEKQKFENCFSQNWNFKHAYPEELYLCTQTCPLTDAENFANQMRHGKYKEKFKKDSFDNALTYLTARIAERKAQKNPPNANEATSAKASPPPTPLNPKVEYAR